MLSLLVVVLSLASATPQNYGQQYEHKALDGENLEFVDVDNYQNHLASTYTVVSTFGNSFDINGLFSKGVMGVTVFLLIANFIGITLFPSLTKALNEIGGSSKETIMDIVGRQATSIEPDTLNTLAMVVDKAIQTFQQIEDPSNDLLNFIEQRNIPEIILI